LNSTHRETKIGLVLGLTIVNLSIYFLKLRYVAPGADTVFGSGLAFIVLAWISYTEVKELCERGDALISSRIAKQLATFLCSSLRNTGLLVWGLLLCVGTLLSGPGFLTEPATIFSTAAWSSLCYTAPRLLEAGAYKTINFSSDIAERFRDIRNPMAFTHKPLTAARSAEHRPAGAVGLNLASPGECGDDANKNRDRDHVHQINLRNGGTTSREKLTWIQVFRRIEALELQLEAYGGQAQ